MRQKLGLIITVVVVIALLLVINSVSYVSQQRQKDSEPLANRSTYHGGPTGTRALYDFLSDSGFSVMRWRGTADKLLSEGSEVRTFVIVGSTQIPVEEEESAALLQWVANGGHLVLPSNPGGSLVATPMTSRVPPCPMRSPCHVAIEAQIVEQIA